MKVWVTLTQHIIINQIVYQYNDQTFLKCNVNKIGEIHNKYYSNAFLSDILDYKNTNCRCTKYDTLYL